MTQGAYEHADIEARWQTAWSDANIYCTPDTVDAPTYVLGMYPYPSGQLHMGHVRNYTITDAYARYRRMRGDDVFHPMGWDAFGLPAENAAKERDTNPRDWTHDCIDTMRTQMESMGFGYDWDREVTTCEPEYYRWNQYFFRRFHEEGLVERRNAEVNWCPSCETVLADEQVEGDEELCWRCDTPVTQRELAQWFLKITEYADELESAIDELDGWPDNVRQMQRNWIGRQEGTILPFEIDGHTVNAFTTRADTVYGATFFALAVDHPITKELLAEDDQRKSITEDGNETVREFVEAEADPEGDEPKGVPTGLQAVNPVTGAEIPVYVADFVLSDVGTGALMGVPAHDDRDHDFASKMDIDIVPVIAPETEGASEPVGPDVTERAFTDDGVLIDSAEYTGLDSETARERITADTANAEWKTQYRLRDWGISRQRYWGTPIPVIHCEECGPVPVPEEDLPVELPEFINTTGNPLEAAEEWKAAQCPDCSGQATRETDTMDTFVDSSWYFLRYVSPDLADAPFDTDRANRWMPVDQYVGGIEHAVMHLLYARFFTKVLADHEGLDYREPIEQLLNHGMVHLEGEKMSKSKGNVVSPQRIVEEYGADTARLFIMQVAQPDRGFDWTERGVRSTHELLGRLADLVDEWKNGTPAGTDERDSVAQFVSDEIDATVTIATEEYDELSFSKALREVQNLIGTLRRYRNHTEPHSETFERGLEITLRLLAPVAPHLSEELYQQLGNEEFIVTTDWPEPTVSREETGRRRVLIENTREDVRQIIDVANITDPERIEIVVTSEWKHEALGMAIESDAPNLISELMEAPSIREHGDEAASFGQTLQDEREALSLTLPPSREYEALETATWLIEGEFEAPVVVMHAAEADEKVARKAEPGRPAINIVE